MGHPNWWFAGDGVEYNQYFSSAHVKCYHGYCDTLECRDTSIPTTIFCIATWLVMIFSQRADAISSIYNGTYNSPKNGPPDFVYNYVI